MYFTVATMKVLLIFLISTSFMFHFCVAENDYDYDCGSGEQSGGGGGGSTGLSQCSEQESLDLLYKGNAKFTGKCLFEAHQVYPTESFIISPFSTLIPVAVMALYSEKDTYNQLISVLNLRNKDDIRCAFPTLTAQLKQEENVTLNLANRVFASDKSPLSQRFLDDSRDVFNAGAENLNFSDSSGAADRINQWVANETDDRIKNIVDSSMFGPETRLALANAIYFLGNWVKQFNGNDTKDRDFRVNNTTTIQLPTMYQQSFFKYAENADLDCKILEMSYKGDNFTFAVFLPNEVEGISDLIRNLQDSDVFYNAYNQTVFENVQVSLPKIKTESGFNLIKLLQTANVTDIFDGNKSNLNGILEKDETLAVSTAVQKAFVEIDEKGTEAAAANVIVINVTATRDQPKEEPKVFNADHPFVYYILYKRNPLFCGKFQPQSK